MSIKTDRADGVVTISSPAMAERIPHIVSGSRPKSRVTAAFGPSDRIGNEPLSVRLHIVNNNGVSRGSFLADEKALDGLIADLTALRAVVFGR